MYHFFVSPDQIDGQNIIITGSDVNHIKNVLRMRCGEELLISNGRNADYLCRIWDIGTDTVRA